MPIKSEVLVLIKLFNCDLPSLSKRLRQDYAQFLIDFYKLQEDPVQQRILELAKTFKNQHDMNQALYQTITVLENSTRPLVFWSASGCRASENFDISSEN